jgi:hypothetical protein
LLNQSRNREVITISSEITEETSIQSSCQIIKTNTSANILSNFVDKISVNEQNDIWKLLAITIFKNNIPFSIVENEEFVQLFKKVRPALKLPKRQTISGPLLDEEYERVINASNSMIESSGALTIVVDGWSNIRNEGIINIILCTPKPLLYKSIPTGSQSHTGEYLRQLVKIPIERFGAKNFLAVISDNGSDVKLMRKLISQEYPHIYTFGCAAHGLNLLIQDICKLKTVNNILNRCKEIVKEVTRSHAKKHKFREYCGDRRLVPQ